MAREDNVEMQKLKVSKETLREGLKIFEYIGPYKWHFFAGLILLSISSLSALVVVKAAGVMVDIASGIPKYGLTLRDIGIGLIIFFVAQGFISFGRILLFAVVSEKGIAAIRTHLFSQMLTLPIVFYEKTRVGELISRITADVEKMYSVFSITLAEFLRQIIILVGGVIFLAVDAPQLTLTMIATFPVIVVSAMFFGRYIRKLSKERQKILADSNTIMNETVTNIRSVKSFSNEQFESKRYGSSITDVVKVALKYAKARGLFAAFIVSILSGALFFVIWKGAMMIQGGDITTGELVSFVSLTALIGGSIAGLGNFYSELLGALGATERVRQIIGESGEIDIHAESKPLALKGDVAFKDVQFEYPTRDDITVLKGLNFKLAAGKTAALVGTSGAGKSTIMQLLLRFYNLSGGQILVDGKDISTYDLKSFRSNFALVPQEVLLFGGSIRENILYGRPNATEDEIIEAARKSNSWEFIQSFPEGLETIVGDRGVKLSGGQRQRIAIARAILRDPAILLLDEATSSLDAESERVVQEALQRLMKGRTSLVIAHRLATVREVDMIYVLDDGKVIEQGTHEELFDLDGTYTNLAKLQFEMA